MMMKTITTLFVGAALFQTTYAGEPDAFQEPLAPVEDSDDWEFRLGLYAPIVGLEGTSRVGPAVVPIDIGFDDILDNFDAGIVLAGDVRKGKFSMVGDFIWLKLSTSAAPTPPVAYVATKIEQTVASLAFGYELFEDDCWTVDALVGGAYTGLEIDNDVIFPRRRTTLGISEDWVDPFIGVRFRYRPTDHWRFFGRIDYGGFGWVSEHYFQAILGAGYQFTEQVGLFAAYRYLSVDYVDVAAFAYDVDTSGPQVGLVFSF